MRIRIQKVLIILLIIIMVLFSASNYNAVNTIDNSAYVIAMGIDLCDSDMNSNGNNNNNNEKANNKIKLTLQIAIPEASSAGSSSEELSQSSPVVTNSVECSSIFSGISQINSYLSKKINLSYCKIVVFSQDIAQNGVGNYVSTLINDIELRPTCHVLVSKCKAKYFLENSKPILENLSSKYYEFENSSEKNTGYTEAITILDFYNSCYDSFKQPYAILGNISNSNSNRNETNDKNEKHVECLRISYF